MFGNDKRDNYYFDGFVAQCRFSCELTRRTHELLSDFHHDQVKDDLIELHGIEHAADQKQHEIMERLTKEFLAPLEREDIVAITQELDDLTDAVEDIMITIYEYDLKEIDDVVLKYMDIIDESEVLLQDVMKKLANFKKDGIPSEEIIEINKLEEAGDRLYREAVHNLFANETDTRRIFTMKDIYLCLETVMDDIEDIANLIESIVMKNS